MLFSDKSQDLLPSAFCSSSPALSPNFQSDSNVNYLSVCLPHWVHPFSCCSGNSIPSPTLTQPKEAWDWQVQQSFRFQKWCQTDEGENNFLLPSLNEVLRTDMRWHIQSLETQLGKDLVVACANKVRPINTLVIHLIILQFHFSDWLHHILSVGELW